MPTYRFSLDDQIDVSFIAFIRQKANGGSVNKAMKLFAQNQYAIYIDRNTSPNGHSAVSGASNQGETANECEINLSGLDAAFSEFKE